MKRVILLAALVAAAVAAPVQAKPPHPPHPGPTPPNPCVAHPVAYVVDGTLASGSLTAASGGTFNGTLTVNVMKVNHHAKPAKGTTQTYTLTGATVNLHGENPAALMAGSHVHLDGTITMLPGHCSQTGFTPTITITRVDIHPPKPPKP